MCLCSGLLQTQDKVTRAGDNFLWSLASLHNNFVHKLPDDTVLQQRHYLSDMTQRTWIIISLWQNLTYPNAEVNSTSHSIKNSVINCNNYKLLIEPYPERSCKHLYSQLCFSQRTEKWEPPDESCWNSYVNPYHTKFRSLRTIIVSSKLLKRFKFCHQKIVSSQVYLHAQWLGFRMFLKLHRPVTYL